MPRPKVIVLLVAGFVFSVAQAVMPERAPTPSGLVGGTPTGARQDTVWFGGDDGNGVAFVGGVWDFDTITNDPFQGWTSCDVIAESAVNFSHVTRDSFLAHGDPCIPIAELNPGIIWCGVHEDEANLRDFITGMGYGHHMHQRALSPNYAIDPAIDSVDIRFEYFLHTEWGYDFTYIYLLCYDSGGDLLEEIECDSFDGVYGDPENLATYDPPGPIAPPRTLPVATATIQFEFRVTSDHGWSDEDGFWDCPCGPFGADDVQLSVGGMTESFDFDDGAQGWTFDKGAGLGTYMSIIPQDVWVPWTANLMPMFSGPIDGNVLGFVDMEGSPYDPPGLVPGQRELGLSGVVPHSGYDPFEYNTTIVEWDHYVNFPQSSGGHYRIGYKYYPYTTSVNPAPHWSPRMGQGV